MSVKYVLRSFSDDIGALEDNKYLCEKPECYCFIRPQRIEEISMFDNEKDAIEAARKVTNCSFFEVVKIISKPE